ncbi:unnamed protein product [Ceratitis capitata]|uniref:(Mediterranean fruit fly) hypothetical protein n=1 Tax=Ceratitis capitata TaxID=7213 RepID=A0A811V345_CERCA|nr:unnamed protein product [Ceratitis capitata]
MASRRHTWRLLQANSRGWIAVMFFEISKLIAAFRPALLDYPECYLLNAPSHATYYIGYLLQALFLSCRRIYYSGNVMHEEVRSPRQGHLDFTRGPGIRNAKLSSDGHSTLLNLD